MSEIQRDLFGSEINSEHDDLANELDMIEGNNFDSRVKRFRYLDGLEISDTCEYGKCSGLGIAASLECKLLFEEAKKTYINGEFMATILLCQAFIEHWLTPYLSENNKASDLPRGLHALIELCGKEKLVHPFILDRINELRLFRNPIAHPKQYKYPYSINQRMIEMRMNQEELLENYAKKAIEIMFAVIEV